VYFVLKTVYGLVFIASDASVAVSLHQKTPIHTFLLLFTSQVTLAGFSLEYVIPYRTDLLFARKRSDSDHPFELTVVR
jgi:hypothetical protein